eukprot:7485781-Pyramimonas_sp.AAC.1
MACRVPASRPGASGLASAIVIPQSHAGAYSLLQTPASSGTTLQSVGAARVEQDRRAIARGRATLLHPRAIASPSVQIIASGHRLVQA